MDGITARTGENPRWLRKQTNNDPAITPAYALQMEHTDTRVRAQLEAMLLAPALKPLTEAFGEYSAIAQQTFGEALARLLQRQ